MIRRKTRKWVLGKKSTAVYLLGGLVLAILLVYAVIMLGAHESAASVPDAAETGSGAPSEAPCVRLTVTGASLLPAVELDAGSDAAVTWRVEESGEVYTGLNPGIVFGSPALRHVRLTATDGSGDNALGDIVTFNIGFDHTMDAGKYNVGSGYDHPPQAVSGLEGVRAMTGLVRFLAATPSLTGPIDFSGMSRLEYIECFGAALTAVELTGCDGLIRLCVENNDLSAVDLNPVSRTLRDLRLSGNRQTVTIAPLRSPMLALYHYCAQSIVVVNHPAADQLPAVEELWDWKSGQSGELVLRSAAVRSVLTFENAWTSADFTGQFPPGSGGYVDAHSCRLSSVTLTGCGGLLHLDLYDNRLDQPAVDGVLAEAASWGTYGGKLNLAGNAPPSSAGEHNAAILRERGWTVLH